MKWPYLLFAVLILLPMVSAIPPVQVAEGSDFLQVLYPEYQEVPQNEEFDLIVNVLNKTSIKTNLTTDCNVHLFNYNGTETYHSKLGFNTHDVHFISKINANNFSELGIHAFRIICNSSTEMGFANGLFEVTSSGQPHPGDNIIVFFSLLFIILLGGIAYVIIHSIAHAVTLDFDVKDLAINYGIYFSIVGYYFLQNFYNGSAFINTMMLWMIQIGAVTQIFLPTLYFILTLTIGNWMRLRFQETGGEEGWPRST